LARRGGQVSSCQKRIVKNGVMKSLNNPKCAMEAPILGNSPFKIRPSEFLPAPLSPATPFLPHEIRPTLPFAAFSPKANF
jgi:hypothetical protein